MKNIYKVTFPALKSLFSAEVVLKAAYSLVDQAYIHIDEDEENWQVMIGPKDDGLDTEKLQGEFENELLFQAVRLNVYNRTHAVRELLLARAMASTMIDTKSTYEDEEDSDYSEEEMTGLLSSWFKEK